MIFMNQSNPFGKPTLFCYTSHGKEFQSLIMHCVKKNHFVCFHPSRIPFSWLTSDFTILGKERQLLLAHLSILCIVLYTSVTSPLVCLLSKLKSPTSQPFLIRKLLQSRDHLNCSHLDQLWCHYRIFEVQQSDLPTIF